MDEEIYTIGSVFTIIHLSVPGGLYSWWLSPYIYRRLGPFWPSPLYVHCKVLPTYAPATRRCVLVVPRKLRLLEGLLTGAVLVVPERGGRGHLELRSLPSRSLA